MTLPHFDAHRCVGLFFILQRRLDDLDLVVQFLHFYPNKLLFLAETEKNSEEQRRIGKNRKEQRRTEKNRKEQRKRNK